MTQRTFITRRTVLAGAAAAWVAAPRPAAAAGYPEQPIRLVVPFPPGGSTDLIGRAIGRAVGEALNATVVIDNRGGAAGSIGATDVMKAKPDGYTVLLAALTSHAVYQTFYPKTVRFHLAKDFEPVAVVGEVPQAFVVNASVKANSIAEFVALARARPGQISVASAGNGSTQQMAAFLLAANADIQLLQVPYKGSGPAVTDLLGGQVDAMFGTVPSVQEHLRAGRLRMLGVTSSKRLPGFANVSTFAEAGFQGFDVNSLFGVLAPAGTPEEIVGALARAVERGLAQKSIQDLLAPHGVLVGYRGPGATRAAVAAELRKWEDVVRVTGVRPE